MVKLSEDCRTFTIDGEPTVFAHMHLPGSNWGYIVYKKASCREWYIGVEGSNHLDRLLESFAILVANASTGSTNGKHLCPCGLTLVGYELGDAFVVEEIPELP